MAKADEATLQPDETNALRALIGEFIGKLQNIDNEIETLKGDRKELIEAYKEKLDMKTLQAAMRVIKIKASIERKDTFDTFTEVLEEQ